MFSSEKEKKLAVLKFMAAYLRRGVFKCEGFLIYKTICHFVLTLSNGLAFKRWL